MTVFGAGPTRPEHPAGAAPPSRPERVRAGGAAGLLFTPGTDTRRESRQVAIGMGILILVSAVLLNFGIYQGAQGQLVQQRWELLAHRADSSREQIREIFATFERQIRYVGDESRFSAWVRGAMEGSLSDADRHQLNDELDRAAQVFGLDHLVVLSPEGVPLAAVSRDSLAPSGHAELVQRLAEGQRTWVADIHPNPDGHRVFELAMQVPGATFAGHVPVLVAAADAEETLIPLLTGWSDLVPTAFAYLVRPQGNQVKFLTSPDRGQVMAPAAPVAMGETASRPAAMAATGIESSIEQATPSVAPYCAVTRFMPELGWGLVARADRRFVMSGLRNTITKLLAMDFAILLVAALIIWQWRRSYTRGLAKHEMRVTHRHAERVQAIFDTAFDAIVTFDRAGRVRTVNRAGEELFGRTAANMEGQPLHRILRWSGPNEVQEHELPTSGVVRIANALRPDGQTIPTELSLGESGADDELLYTAIVRDIRDRVEAERQIRASAEGLECTNRRLEEVNAQLEEASRLKSEFLANTSHELRTPLNGMMGFLQLVLDGMCQSKDEEREFLKQALQCSRHLLNLINDVLDIARIEAGKLSLDIQKVDIATLFSEVRTVTHVQAAQKDVRLVFVETDDPDCAVRCDLNKAKQVLINLVGNSLKFTSKGSITVRAIPHPDLGHVRFEVVDTGIGIPRDQQSIIFEKFAQGDGSTTRKYGGAGLGLAISKSLVELMGGVIGVQSEGRGKGTTMYFSLPVWSEQAPEAQSDDDVVADQIDGPAGGALVLVVEDDPVFRKFVTVVLHQHGYRTVEVASAESGWLRVRRLRPAVVVLDYALSCSEGAGIRTGWDLAERITTDPETRHIPVLFVTGFESEVREKLLSTAFARKPSHLVKPIEPAALVSKVEEMVAGISGRQVRILMAEDDPCVTAFVRKVLPEQRFHMEVALNGEECLHILRTQPNGFDLLLLDLMMPEVSGYDVLRDMTLSGTGSKIPVVVFTNCPEPRNQEEKRLLEEGMVLEVIAKASIHDNPQLLTHLIDWHMQVKRETGQPPEQQAEAA